MPATTAVGHPVTSYVLITNPGSQLLTVRSKHSDLWRLPGGIVEPYESPLDAVSREVREELALTINVGEADLLSVEWILARTPGRRARLAFLFAGPTLTSADVAQISLQRAELDAWSWLPSSEFPTLLHPVVARRVSAALHSSGRSSYRERRDEGIRL
ncbi:NUDIX hydrolase [Streptomyces sp. NPDC094045]|uniref:NUDIX domain-containing protein n=1 Tax=Streptomyces sp. NPDC094045 TaxID=3161019 RepID=UPI0033988E2B